jgi:hypothetical protein
MFGPLGPSLSRAAQSAGGEGTLETILLAAAMTGGDLIAAWPMPPALLFLGPLTPILFVALIIAVVVLLVRGLMKAAGIVAIIVLIVLAVWLLPRVIGA